MIEGKRFVVRHKDGRYEKVGGYRTDDLQEAQVIGWTKKSHERWTRYGCVLIPVRIELGDE